MVSLVSSSWLVVGDFNEVLGAHEALVSRSPASGSCEDFRLMINDCDLVGIRSQGTRFSWVRGRSNRTRVERRLDRVLVSDGCISCWREISCVALPRICFDHCPLLVRLLDFEKLRNLKKTLKSWNWEVFGDLNSAIAGKSAELHSIQLDLSNRGFSDDLFMAEAIVHSELDVLLRRHKCFYRDRSRVRWLRDGDQSISFFHASIKHDVIPSLVTAAENAFLTSIPSVDDIHDAVFAMDATSAPGLDGFSGSFYQRCWDVVGSDVVLAVQDFFITGVIFLGLNSSFIVLLSKLRDSISLDQFRPIKKCYRGNLAMKIDICKDFDTLDWCFLCRVLQAFGFSSVFVDWINNILRSSRLSVLFNGVPEGYFCCSRGVRQGDPLSSLLVCIVEDFLSRLLKRLVGSSQIMPISSPMGFLAPTHLLYVDDVLIFCRCTQKNLKHIMIAFTDYGDISS
ncbi:hypothetical protein LWI28_016785 [Acer negundo]|uniref:Reverse transcriptase domain-containing protein n=1 Tax=Acer negundo TaxID=4023 RepID=A0AAD5JGN8_ACENE|nr:hypothetical protein LWI28_016785 [Acer negundo]